MAVARKLDSLERLLNVLNRIPQYDRPAVRAGHGVVGFRQFGEEPVHFVLLEGHVDFDGGVAGDGGGDAGCGSFPGSGIALRARFGRAVRGACARRRLRRRRRARLLRRRCGRRRARLRSRCAGVRRQISEKIACCAGDSSRTIGISRRWLSTFCRGALLQNAFEEDALVGDVLVDDPETIFVYGEDE